jgi:hypothetical protein
MPLGMSLSSSFSFRHLFSLSRILPSIFEYASPAQRLTNFQQIYLSDNIVTVKYYYLQMLLVLS